VRLNPAAEELSTSTRDCAIGSLLTSLEYNSGRDLEFLDLMALKNGAVALLRLIMVPLLLDMFYI